MVRIAMTAFSICLFMALCVQQAQGQCSCAGTGIAVAITPAGAGTASCCEFA